MPLNVKRTDSGFELCSHAELAYDEKDGIAIKALAKSVALRAFKKGADWQAKQSPWISVEDKLPSLNQKVIVYNGKQVYISHRTEKDYAKDTNFFLYGLQTYNVVAWMPIPSFDEILEANKDVPERIKEKGE